MWIGIICVFLVFILIGILDILIDVLKKEEISFSYLDPRSNIHGYFTHASKKRTLRIKDLIEKKDFFSKSKIWTSTAFWSQCFVWAVAGSAWGLLWFYLVGIVMEILTLCPIFFWIWFSLYAIISALFMAKEAISLLEKEISNIKKWVNVLYWVFAFIPSVVHIFWDLLQRYIL